MKTENSTRIGLILGVVAIFSAWVLSGCNIASSSGGGLPVSANDSASFHFVVSGSSLSDTGGDSINVAKIRQNLQNQSSNVDDTTIQITNLKIDFDDSTMAFVDSNATKKFTLKVYYNNLLALETDTTSAVSINPTDVTYLLNDTALANGIYGAPAGFALMTSAIRDTTISSIKLQAILSFADSTAPKPGVLKVNCVLTAQAKVKS